MALMMEAVLTSETSSVYFNENTRYIPGSEPGSSVGIASGYGLNDRAIEVRFTAEAKGFFL
jgi:hypothetical protein